MNQRAIVYFQQALQHLERFSVPEIGTFTRSAVTVNDGGVRTWSILYSPDDTRSVDTLEQWLRLLEDIPVAEATKLATRIGHELLLELETKGVVKCPGLGDLHIQDNGVIQFQSQVIRQTPAYAQPEDEEPYEMVLEAPEKSIYPPATSAGHEALAPSTTVKEKSKQSSMEGGSSWADYEKTQNEEPVFRESIKEGSDSKVFLGVMMVVGLLIVLFAWWYTQSRVTKAEEAAQKSEKELAIEELNVASEASSIAPEDQAILGATTPESATESPGETKTEEKKAKTEKPEAKPEKPATDATPKPAAESKPAKPAAPVQRIEYHILLAKNQPALAAQELEKRWRDRDFPARLLPADEPNRFHVSLMAVTDRDQAIARAEGLDKQYNINTSILGLRFQE